MSTVNWWEGTTSLIRSAGCVLITTLSSFVVEPPGMVAGDSDSINWHNVFVLIAGTLSVLVLGRRKGKEATKKLSLFLLLALLILVCSYELLVFSNSVECFDEGRFVVSAQPVRPEVQVAAKYHETHSSTPIKSLLEDYGCASLQIWNLGNLFMPYYGILTLYIVMLTVFTMLLFRLSTLTKTTK